MGAAMWSQELDSMIPVGPFQLRTLRDSACRSPQLLLPGGLPSGTPRHNPKHRSGQVRRRRGLSQREGGAQKRPPAAVNDAGSEPPGCQDGRSGRAAATARCRRRTRRCTAVRQAGRARSAARTRRGRQGDPTGRDGTGRRGEGWEPPAARSGRAAPRSLLPQQLQDGAADTAVAAEMLERPLHHLHVLRHLGTAPQRLRHRPALGLVRPGRGGGDGTGGPPSSEAARCLFACSVSSQIVVSL